MKGEKATLTYLISIMTFSSKKRNQASIYPLQISTLSSWGKGSFCKLWHSVMKRAPRPRVLSSSHWSFDVALHCSWKRNRCSHFRFKALHTRLEWLNLFLHLQSYKLKLHNSEKLCITAKNTMPPSVASPDDDGPRPRGHPHRAQRPHLPRNPLSPPAANIEEQKG